MSSNLSLPAASKPRPGGFALSEREGRGEEGEGRGERREKRERGTGDSLGQDGWVVVRIVSCSKSRVSIDARPWGSAALTTRVRVRDSQRAAARPTPTLPRS